MNLPLEVENRIAGKIDKRINQTPNGKLKIKHQPK
jgi:hypothetical protein